MREFIQKNIKGDYYIWFVVLALSIFGILAVYSATGSLAYAEKGGNTEYYLMKHAFMVIFGLATMWLTHQISIQYFSRIAQIMFYLALPLLIYTLIFGVEINDARRWISLPL